MGACTHVHVALHLRPPRPNLRLGCCPLRPALQASIACLFSFVAWAPPAPCPPLRSAIPVVTCVLAILVESRYPSRQELTALVMLTLGVMLAVWQVRKRRWYCVLLEVEVGGERQGLSRCAAALTALPPPYRCLQGTVSGKPYAIVFCLIGTVCNGAMMTFSGKVRLGKENRAAAGGVGWRVGRPRTATLPACLLRVCNPFSATCCCCPHRCSARSWTWCG